MMNEHQHIPRRQNSEQERARQAWAAIREVQDKDRSKERILEKEYRSLARRLNALLQSNGLGQTLGFLKARGRRDNAHYLLLRHLTTWMQEPRHFAASNSAVMLGGDDGLLRWIVDEETSSSDYRRATTECLAFCNWLRRFAEGELAEAKEVQV
jgi:CRISPR-associated protein Cmr5